MTTIEPTFEAIAASARFITPRPPTSAPLPCENQRVVKEIYADKKLAALFERFPVLDTSFMNMTYPDSILKKDMPVFVAIDTDNQSINSDHAGTHVLTARLNPKLRTDKRNVNVRSEGSLLNASIGCVFIAGLMYGGAVAVGAAVVGASVFAAITSFMAFWIFLYLGGSDERTIVTVYQYDFAGIIPDDVREIYHREKSNFDAVFLICDAKNRWTSQTRVLPPPNPDPLLVGVTHLKNGKIITHLLAKFNRTPAEQYVLDEFAI